MASEAGLVQFLVFAIFFLGVCGFSFILYGVLLKFAKTLGIRHERDVIRWASTAKPALGGIIFYIVFLIAAASHAMFFDGNNEISGLQTLGSLGALSLAFIMGLADDAYNTRPFLKFGVQVLCGIILILTGTGISLFESNWLNVLVTIIWVVGIMNSINMLDNMDGITTLTSMFILLNALIFMSLHGAFQSPDFMVCIGVIAALFAFLFFNWNPAKMYMGDSGSQFLGMLLAMIGIRYFWNSSFLDGTVSQWQQIFTLLIAFLLPIVDTTIVSINRIGRGQSPFVGGKDHTTHNLSYLGLSDSQVALTFAGISIANLLFCYVIFRFVDVWNSSIGIICTVYALTIFVAFFILCKKQRHFYTDQT